MNTHLQKMIPLLLGSSLLLSACSEDNSSFETPSSSTTPENSSPVSQKNFILLFSPIAVGFLSVNGYTEQTAEISVKIGDNKNQLVTAERTIYFETQWGLIEPSCVTEDGTCSVTWTTGDPQYMPSDLKNTIVAYSHKAEESYDDLNGNNVFDDGDVFEDISEPYIDRDRSNSYTAGDKVIDTVNANDPTGENGQHDAADSFFNGRNCQHSSQCSTVMDNITVWNSGNIVLTTETFNLGGTVSGLTGTLVLETAGAADLTITADGDFTFVPPLPVTSSYDVQVKTNPAGQTCSVTNGTGIITADVTTVTVTCS